MTIQERIIQYLSDHPEGVDDDSLALALDLSQRPVANSICRQLENKGIVVRRRIKGKIRNFLTTDAPIQAEQSGLVDSANGEPPWFWVGNVQRAVVKHLQSLEYTIRSAAKTETRERGHDIFAVDKSGHTLWVSAKGYPERTGKTSPPVRARHRFSHALFELILWRGESLTAHLALALPDQPTYRKLTSRVSWFLEEVQATIYWVSEGERVGVESFREQTDRD